MAALEEDIVQVRSDLITKDAQLHELTQQAASEEQAAEVRKLKREKNALQAQLECKTRQLKVSLHFFRQIRQPGCADQCAPYER